MPPAKKSSRSGNFAAVSSLVLAPPSPSRQPLLGVPAWPQCFRPPLVSICTAPASPPANSTADKFWSPHTAWPLTFPLLLMRHIYLHSPGFSNLVTTHPWIIQIISARLPIQHEFFLNNTRDGKGTEISEHITRIGVHCCNNSFYHHTVTICERVRWIS